MLAATIRDRMGWLYRVKWQVEKLIEETKQVQVMEPRVVPETRTISVTIFVFGDACYLLYVLQFYLRCGIRWLGVG